MQRRANNSQLTNINMQDEEERKGDVDTAAKPSS